MLTSSPPQVLTLAKDFNEREVQRLRAEKEEAQQAIQKREAAAAELRQELDAAREKTSQARADAVEASA